MYTLICRQRANIVSVFSISINCIQCKQGNVLDEDLSDLPQNIDLDNVINIHVIFGTSSSHSESLLKPVVQR